MNREIPVTKRAILKPPMNLPMYTKLGNINGYKKVYFEVWRHTNEQSVDPCLCTFHYFSKDNKINGYLKISYGYIEYVDRFCISYRFSRKQLKVINKYMNNVNKKNGCTLCECLIDKWRILNDFYIIPKDAQLEFLYNEGIFRGIKWDNIFKINYPTVYQIVDYVNRHTVQYQGIY